MATTSPDNLRTPNPGDPYNLVPDLATLAGDVQSALNTRANAYKGTASQRAAFLSIATVGALWQDTDGIGMLWKRGASQWVPAVWRWSGSSAQMNAFTQAPNGFEWFNTTETLTYVRLDGAWSRALSGTVLGFARQTSGSQASGTKFSLTGLSVPITLAAAQNVRVDLTFRRYSTVGGDLVDFMVEDGGTPIWRDTTQANSGGVTTGLSTTHSMILQLAAGSHTLTAALQRVSGSGNITSAPSAIAPNMLSVTAV